MHDLGLNILIKVINQATAPIRAITNNFREIQVAGQKAKQAFDFAAKAGQAAQAVNSFSQQTRGLLVAPIEGAKNFEQALVTMGALLHKPQSEMGEFASAAQRLGETTRYSALESVKAMGALVNAGVGAEDVLQVLPKVLSLAATDNMDLAQTATIVAKALSAMELKAGDAGTVVDTLAKAGVESVTSISSLAETMEYALGTAHTYKVSLQEVAAVSEAISSVSTGSSAGTEISDMILRLANAKHEGLKALRELKIDPFYKKGPKKGQFRPIIDTLEEFQRKTAPMTDQKRGRYIDDVFGKVAEKGVSVALIAAGTGKLREMEKGLHEVGYAQKIAADMTNSTEGASKKLSGTVDTLNISLGNQLLPTIKAFDSWAATVVKDLTAWTEKHPDLTKGILATTAAVGTLSAILGGALTTVAVLASTLGVLAIAMGWNKTGAQLLGGAFQWLVGSIKNVIETVVFCARAVVVLAGEALPVVWAFTVSTAQMAAVLAVQAVSAVWSFIVATGRMVMMLVLEGIPALLRAQGAYLEFAGAVVTSAVTAIWSFIKALPGMAVTLLTETIPALALGAWGVLAWGASLVWSTVVGIGSFLAKLPGLAAVLLTETLPALAASMWGMLAFGASAIWSGTVAVAGFLASLPELASALLAAVVPAVVAATGAIIEMGLAFLASPVGWVVLAIAAVVGVVWLLKDAWVNVSHALLDNQWVAAIVTGCLLISGPIGWLVAAALWITAKWEPLKGFFLDVWEGIKTAFSSGIDWIMGKLQPLFDAMARLKGWMGGLWGGTPAAGPGAVGSEASAPFSMAPVAELPDDVPSMLARPPEVGNPLPPGLTLPGLPDLTKTLPPGMTVPPELAKLMQTLPPGMAGTGALPSSVGADGSSPMQVQTPRLLSDPPHEVKVGGTLKITIDSEGRARVREMTREGPMDFSVDAGFSGGGL